MTDVLEARQNELKSKKICRFCLSQDEANLTNIYSRENRMKAPLPLQVMACVSIEVFSNECMPSYVCNECRMMFNYCYCFKQMCKKADTCLRHFPLTGVWSAPLTKPKLAPELAKAVVEPPVTLNALPIPRNKIKNTIIEKMESEDGTIMTMVTEPNQRQEEEHAEEEEVESEPEPEEDTKPKTFNKLGEKSNHKLLNKSAIRILNKEAQKEAMEPRISKPRLKRDNDGNIAIVTEILDPDMVFPPDPVENAALVETNVFPCPHCERSFPLRQLLDIHMVNHSRERSFNCSNCDKSFFSKYDLQKHMLVHTGEKPFKCVVCDKGFTRSTLLHRHEKTHTDIPKFICVFCEKPFISEEEMEKHTERHRKKRPFTCKICNKSFAFKQGLERHEVVHCRFQPYQCQYCDQSFSTSSKLSRHLTAHAGDRPYPCKLCPKSYLLSHHLTRHMRSHKNGSGSYKCNDCDKTFSSRDDLIYHSAVHATQTLVCPLCKDAFDDIETVTDHVKQHAEGEAFACEFCDLIFMTADRLQEHTDVYHVDEMVAYNEDDQANAEKKNAEAKNNKSNESNANREIDEVIEEFLYEEFSDPDNSGGHDRASSIIIKEETEWQNQIVETTEVEKYESDDETNAAVESEYMNIIDMSDVVEETPAKLSKISQAIQQITKKAAPSPAPLRHKAPIRASQSTTPLHSKSPQPKENKKPLPKTLADTRIKVENRSSPTAPKTRQPTIQAALQGLPRSVSVKVVPPGSKPQLESKSSESVKEPTTGGLKRQVPRPAATESQSHTKQSSNMVTRPLRQRLDAKKSPVKAPAPVPVKKSSNSENASSNNKIVEMMIGDKRVKVQRITMTKAQAAAMAREGRIQMKEGTMILKKDPNQGKGPKKSI